MQQVLFRIPIHIPGVLPNGIPIYGYGLMLFIAFLVCTWLAGRRAQKEGISKEIVQDLCIWIFLGGLIGSRIASLLHEYGWQWNWDHVWFLLGRFPRIWDGGVIFYGGAIGAVVVFLVYYRRVLSKINVPTWKILDIAGPSVALGLCIGRVGCLLNGCCYGDVACPHCVGLPFPLSAPARFEMVHRGYQTVAGFTLQELPVAEGWLDSRVVAAVEPGSPAAEAGLEKGDVILEVNGNEVRNATELASYFSNPENWRGHGWSVQLTVMKSDGEHTLEFTPKTLPIHPTQVYESISMFLLFLLLTAFYPLRRHDGEVIALMMIGYGVHRYFNEMLRADARPTGFENNISIMLLIGGVVILAWLWFKPVQYREGKAIATA